MARWIKIPGGIQLGADSDEEQRDNMRLALAMVGGSGNQEMLERLTETEAERAELRAQRKYAMEAQDQSAALTNLVRGLNPSQRKVLKTIHSRKKISLDELVVDMGEEDSRVVGGSVAGIVKLARRFGVDVNDLFKRTTEPSAKDPRKVVSVYRAGPELARLADRNLMEPIEEKKE